MDNYLVKFAFADLIMAVSNFNNSSQSFSKICFALRLICFFDQRTY